MTKRTKAQEKVRDHLDRRGTHTVEITENLVRYWWRILNIAVFRGKLNPPVEIVIKRFKGHYGYCVGYVGKKKVDLGVSPDVTSRVLFMTVLVHEMVHQWEHETYNSMGHAKRFFTWTERVHRYLGLVLEENAYDEDYFTYGEELYK